MRKSRSSNRLESESRPALFALYLVTCCIHLLFFLLAFWGEPLNDVIDVLFKDPSGPMKFYAPIFLCAVILTLSFSIIVPERRWIIIARIVLGVATAAAAFILFGPTLWLPFVIALPLLWWSYKEFSNAIYPVELDSK